MKSATKIIAAAVVAMGVSGLSAPAFADADDYGQHVYTKESQSRFAPPGLSGEAVRALNASKTGIALGRDRLFSSIDMEHKAY